MMLWPSEDGFLTDMQEGRPGVMTVTDSDDLCVVVDTIRAKLDPLGIVPRIRAGRKGYDTMFVFARTDVEPDDPRKGLPLTRET